MKKIIFGTVLSLTLVGIASHAKVNCKHGAAERSLEITYPEQGKKLPCQVTYTKEGQGNPIFTAQAQEGYCEEKLNSMKEKLASTGWTCEESTDQPAKQ